LGEILFFLYSYGDAALAAVARSAWSVRSSSLITLLKKAQVRPALMEQSPIDPQTVISLLLTGFFN
jgi:hypothetical protein